MSVAGYFSLTHPAHAIAYGAAASVAYWICGGMDTIVCLLLFLSVACICGAGNCFNDCFDADIDRVDYPNRPIPSGRATVFGGGVLTAILFVIGFACSLPLLPWCPWVAFVNILMLIVYSTSFKRMPILGNICVAYLYGSVFLFGGMAVGVESFFVMGPLSCVTFFVVLAREMIKDAGTIKRDKSEGRYTLPMIIGIHPTMILAFISLILAVLISYLPVFSWGICYAAAITLVDVFLILVTVKTLSAATSEEVAESKASFWMKIGMLAAACVFVLCAVVIRIL